MSKLIITIGRQYGSGGRKVGKLLAKSLNIPCYDKELLSIVAKDSGFSEEVLENYDEKAVNNFYYFQAGIYSAAQLPLHHQLFIAQLKTIKDIAERESCVFIGRCADYVLSDHPNCVNVFIHSDLENRIKRAVEQYGTPEKHAKKVVHKVDKEREAYYNFYSTKEWGDLLNYHLSIDSSIGIENTAKVIEEYIKMR